MSKDTLETALSKIKVKRRVRGNLYENISLTPEAKQAIKLAISQFVIGENEPELKGNDPYLDFKVARKHLRIEQRQALFNGGGEKK